MNKSSYTKDKIFQLLLEKSPYIKNENIDDVYEKIMSYDYMEKFLNQEGFIISSLTTHYEFNNHDIKNFNLEFNVYTQPFSSYNFLIQVLNLNYVPQIHYDINEGSTSFGYSQFSQFLDTNPNFSVNLSKQINEYKNIYQNKSFLPNWLIEHLNNMFDALSLNQDISIYFDDKYSSRKEQSLNMFFKDILNYHIYAEKENMENLIDQTEKITKQKKI